MKTNHDDPWLCHSCGYMMDAHSAVGSDSATAKEDDLSICLNCGAVYVRHGKRWAAISVAELADLDPEIRRELALIQAVRDESITTDLAARDKRS
jgi:ribosomal protein S27AE